MMCSHPSPPIPLQAGVSNRGRCFYRADVANNVHPFSLGGCIVIGCSAFQTHICPARCADMYRVSRLRHCIVPRSSHPSHHEREESHGGTGGAGRGCISYSVALYPMASYASIASAIDPLTPHGKKFLHTLWESCPNTMGYLPFRSSIAQTFIPYLLSPFGRGRGSTVSLPSFRPATFRPWIQPP